MAEFRVAMTSICTHSGPIFHYVYGSDRCVLTVGAILGPHCQIKALHWDHFTSYEFTWSTKGTLEQQTS